MTAPFTPRRPDPREKPAPAPGETHWGPAEATESLWWLALPRTFVGPALPRLLRQRRDLVREARRRRRRARPRALGHRRLHRRGAGRRGVHGPPRPAAAQPRRGRRAARLRQPGDRHRFLGLATVLLSGFAPAIAVAYVAAAALVATCE
ncbi:MAG: hypothetical protein R3F59_33135 [Myxococcota bacterium]